MRVIFLGLLSMFIQAGKFLFGDFDFLMQAFLTLFVINFFFYLYQDYKNQALKFKTAFLRFLKFFGYLAIIIIAVFLDNLLKLSVIREMTLTTFLFNEISCILKLAVSFGLKVPDFLINYLQELLDSLSSKVDP